MMSTALKAECYAKALGLDRTGMKSICAQTYKIQRTGSSVIRGQENDFREPISPKEHC